MEVIRLSLPISGIQIDDCNWQVMVYGWRGTAYCINSNNDQWLAYIEPLVDLFPSDLKIIGPDVFPKRYAASSWCIGTILGQWKSVFEEWQTNPSVERNELYQRISAKLS